MAPTTSEIIAAVDAGHATARADLEALCRIPSIAFDGFDMAPVHESARATAELLERSGLQDVRLLEGGGAPPAVGVSHTKGVAADLAGGEIGGGGVGCAPLPWRLFHDDDDGGGGGGGNAGSTKCGSALVVPGVAGNSPCRPRR